ncbi:hypothetical protein [Nevskia ramosa]|uniref:hypothetical protein n=1 Tax=Nevskia ramosa TaxID=64002 RepID=UPI00235767C3|nr:hypothetical protein [Nevskia ramosa]
MTLLEAAAEFLAKDEERGLLGLHRLRVDGELLTRGEVAGRLRQQITEKNAARYAWLRERDLDTVHQGGVFAGMTPKNVVLNGIDLDQAIDAAMTTAVSTTPNGGQNR